MEMSVLLANLTERLSLTLAKPIQLITSKIRKMELKKEQKILQQVITEAWSNLSFKQELINSPEEAIKKLTGQSFTLPEGKILQVFDQSNKDVICLNIPQQPNIDDLQLTDKELEMVAGGQLPYVGNGIDCWYPKPPTKLNPDLPKF